MKAKQTTSKRSAPPSMIGSNTLLLNPVSIARLLGAIAFLLVLVSTGVLLSAYISENSHINWLVFLFFVDMEQNIPTFFSALLLVFAALLLLIITILEKNRAASYILHWSILSFGFLFMATDEVVSLHEKLGEPTRNLLGFIPSGIFSFAWVIPGIFLVFVLALFFLKFLWQLPARTRFIFLIAATVYLGGSIGFELIGGYYAELHGLRNLTFSILATVEESLEMAGVIIFIWGLLSYIADNHKEVRFQFGKTL